MTVAAPAREADYGGVVALALGPLAVVEGPRDRVAQRCEGGEEHGVLEAVVAAAAPRLAADAGAGLAGDGGEPGVAGQSRPVGEPRAVADLSEDRRAGPRPDAWKRAEDATEGVRFEQLRDLAGELVSPAPHAVQLDRQLGDHPSRHGFGGHGDGLGVQGRAPGPGKRW